MKAEMLTLLSKTAAVNVINVVTGMLPSTIAAALMELQARVDVTIDLAAMLVTWLYVGRLPGTLVASVVVDRLSPRVALATSSVMLAAFVAVVPWCDQYFTLSADIVLIGACSGFISVTVNRTCFRLWSYPTVRQIIYSLNFSFMVGAAIAPILVNRFLCRHLDDVTHRNRKLSNGTSTPMPEPTEAAWLSKTSTSAAKLHETFLSDSRQDDRENVMSVDVDSPFFDSSGKMRTWSDCETHQQLLKIFVVVSVFQLIACGLLFAAHITCYNSICRRFQKPSTNHVEKSSDQPLESSTATAESNDDHSTSPLELEVKRLAAAPPEKLEPSAVAPLEKVEPPRSKRFGRLLSALFAVFLLSFGNVEVTYGSLVLPYSVRALGMTETGGNRVAFAFWLAMAASRFVLIFMSGRIPPERLLTVSLVVASSSLAVSAGASEYLWISTRSVWPCSVLLGLATATVFPETVAMAVDYVGAASSRLLALLVAAWTVGGIVGPMAAGALFQKYGPAWVMRYSLGAAIASTIIFLVIRRTYRQRASPDSPIGGRFVAGRFNSL